MLCGVCVCVFCVFFHFTCSIEMKKIRWFMVCDYQFLPFSTLSWHRIQNIFVHFVLFNENCNANVVNHKLHNNNNLFHRTDHIHGINKNLHSRNTTRFFGVSIVLQKKICTWNKNRKYVVNTNWPLFCLLFEHSVGIASKYLVKIIINWHDTLGVLF